MRELDHEDRAALIGVIASREYTASQLAKHWAIPVAELRKFVAANQEAIAAERRRLDEPETVDAGTVTPADLDSLWITKKVERLTRLQAVAEVTEEMITNGGMSVAEMTMAVREFRSYLMLAANELGQLLHRGSGDSGTGDTLSVNIEGVDMESLR